MTDLTESRISEIRAALEAAKPAPDRVGGFASQEQAVAFVEALLAEREGMKAEIERLGNVVDGFRREATSWRDVANAHAEKLARVPTLECGAKACREAAVYVYVKNQLSAGGGVSPFRYLRCDRHSMNGATRMALSEAQ